MHHSHDQHSRLDEMLVDLIQQREGVSFASWHMKFQVSSRTLRYELMKIRDIAAAYESTIEKHGNLYQLVSKSEQQRGKLKHMLEHKAVEQALQTPKARLIYLLKQLLLNNEYQTLQVLADSLYISSSTISKDMKKAKEILQKYELHIKMKPHYGIRVEGKEKDIRQCIFDYALIDHTIFSPSHSLQVWSAIVQDEQYEQICTIVQKVLQECEMHMYGVFLNNLLMHVCIVVKRIATNCCFMEEDMVDVRQYPREDKVCYKLVTQISKAFCLTFPDSERQYLLLHLIGKSIYEKSMQPQQDELYHLIERMLYQVKRLYHCDFSQDELLRSDLYTHLKAVVSRLEVGSHLHNPLLHDIKAQIPLAFEIAVYCMKNDWNYLSSISEDELGYIAVHFAAALQRQDTSEVTMVKKKKVLLMCGSGVGTARLMEVTLQRFFQNRIQLDIASSFDHSSKATFDNYDLVLTTMPLPQMQDNVIWLHPIPTKQELDYISTVLFPPLQHAVFEIEQVFHEQFFSIVSLQSKAEVLQYMGKQLEAHDCIEDGFMDGVWQREECASTYVGNLVALPHCIRPRSKRSIISVCMLPEPLLWGENEEVQLIFLLSIKFHDSQYFSAIYDLIVQIVEDAQFVQSCISCTSYAQFLAMLKRAQKRGEENAI